MIEAAERVVPGYVDDPLAELVSYGEFCPIEAGLVMKLADNECEHGRLPGDRTRPCGCWPQEPAPPAPAVTKEDALELATASATSADADLEAPYGRFKNGKPRKSPEGSAARRTDRPRTPAPPAVQPQDAAQLSTQPSLYVENIRAELTKHRDDLALERSRISTEIERVDAAIEALA